MSSPLDHIESWFIKQHWQPFSFQRKVWDAMLQNKNGLLHSATGTGKTYAVWLGAILQCLNNNPKLAANTASPLQILWITPLRALAVDTELALKKPIQDLEIPWRIETRNSDTANSLRAKQNKKLPTALITTPESLSLLLTRTNAEKLFADLKIIIVDEWHQLLGSKRGVQTELALACLRRWQPNVCVWGLSATLGNLTLALQVLLGNRVPLHEAVIIQGEKTKQLHLETVIPKKMERFPWAGHLGLKLLPDLLPHLENAGSSLVFTNTRSHTEVWYQALLEAKPEWAGSIALHHGSLNTDVRLWVENGLRNGSLRCVICTSSMDLGVDYSPVELIVQIGSAKSIMRLIQRAGRSGHQPGATSNIIFVPTHALELLEIAAIKEAITTGHLEDFQLFNKPLDVLIQHLVSLALGPGFYDDELFDEVRSSYTYAKLTKEEWQWALNFVVQGGAALQAYPDFQRVTVIDGLYKVTNKTIARRHRLISGTIISDAEIPVRFLKGGYIGTVEELFIARLRPGDCFILAGKVVELVKVRDMQAYVRLARRPKAIIPRWQGSRLPLSSRLASLMRKQLTHAVMAQHNCLELMALQPIFAIQKRWSILPTEQELLIEQTKTREGHHLFCFPFAGRQINEALATLMAYRLTQQQAFTFSIACNDYGFEILSTKPLSLTEKIIYQLFNLNNLIKDLSESVNASEMAKRRFREIAHIAGLIFRGYPGQPKSNKQLQVSSGLLYDVFHRFDPNNLLLKQAHSEVFALQLEQSHLTAVLEKIQNSTIRIMQTPYPTPFAFPLVVDRLRLSLSSEKLSDRIQQMTLKLEKAVCKK